MVNLAMLPFLTIFGIEVDHGMSPFKSYFDSKEDIMEAVQDLFPPKKYAQDKCDYVCGSDINNRRKSDSNSDSQGDSYDDETKYDDWADE